MEPEPSRSEPPSLSEPLVRLSTTGVQNALAWVHSVVGNLAASVEAKTDRLARVEEELRAEARQLHERLGALEATAGNLLSPAQRARMSTDGISIVSRVPSMLHAEDSSVISEDVPASSVEVAEASAPEVRRLADHMRQLDRSLEHHREQQLHRLNTQDELIAMRLEAVERELSACARPGDLEALRRETEEIRSRLVDQQLPEAVRALGQELRGELQAKADDLREDLRVLSGTVSAKLRLLDEQLEAHREEQSLGLELGDEEGEGPPAEGDTVPAHELRAVRHLAEEARRAAEGVAVRVGRVEGRVEQLGDELLGGASAASRGSSRAEAARSLPRDAAVPIEAAPAAAASEVAELSQRVGHLEGRMGALHEKVDKAKADVVTSPQQALEGAPAAQLAEALKLARDASEQGADALAEVQALALDVRALQEGRVEDLARQVEALRQMVKVVGEGSAAGQLRELERQVQLAGEGQSKAVADSEPQGQPAAGRERSRAGGRMGALEAEVSRLREDTRQLREAIDSEPPEGRLVRVEEQPEERGADAFEARVAGLESRLQELGDIDGRAARLEAAMAQMRSPAPAEGETAELLAALASRAEQLEKQLEGPGGQPDLGPAAARIERLEGRLDTLTGEMEAVQQRQRDALLLAQARAPASPGRSEATAALEAKVRDVAGDVRALKEGKMPAFEEELLRLQDRLKSVGKAATVSPKAAQAAAEQQQFSLDTAVAELDRRSESRLTSVWKELTEHAEKAAIRADQLERSVLLRIEKIESTSLRMRKSGGDDDAAKLAADLAKQLEWLQWRISWLEWATNGEKRSFSRPLDPKAVLPSPPPATNTAACFNQPITEDVEMWAREPISGKQRPRRKMQAPLAPHAEPTVPAEKIGGLRGTRSHGRLPTLNV